MTQAERELLLALPGGIAVLMRLEVVRLRNDARSPDTSRWAAARLNTTADEIEAISVELVNLGRIARESK